MAKGYEIKNPVPKLERDFITLYCDKKYYTSS